MKLIFLKYKKVFKDKTVILKFHRKFHTKDKLLKY